MDKNMIPNTIGMAAPQIVIEAGEMESGCNTEDKNIKAFIEKLDISEIEEIAATGKRIPPLLAKKASIICRRRFRPDEVLATVALDEEHEGEAGLVFTDHGIFAWESDDTFRFAVRYSDIVDTDYNGAGVTIIKKSVEGDELKERVASFPLLKGFVDNLALDSDRFLIYMETDDDDDDEESPYIGIYRELYAFITDIVQYVRG